MLRPLLAAPLALAAMLVLGLACLLLGLVDRSGRSVQRTIRLWSRICLAGFGVRVSVSGEQHVPSGPAVFVANHSSALDIPILFGYLPTDFRVIHKRSLHLLPVVGWCLYLGGHVSIDRANPFRARRSLASAARRIRTGTSVAVFPEGTRSRDGSVGPFKRGSFVLALNAGVPLVPVSLEGVKRVVPGRVPAIRAGRVALRIHPALPTKGHTPEEAEALAEQVRSAIRQGCSEAGT